MNDKEKARIEKYGHWTVFKQDMKDVWSNRKRYKYDPTDVKQRWSRRFVAATITGLLYWIGGATLVAVLALYALIMVVTKLEPPK